MFDLAIAIDGDYREDLGASPGLPEQTLWRLVILQACRDAFGGTELRRYLARRFLNGRGLRIAMELAGVPLERAPAIRSWRPGTEAKPKRRKAEPVERKSIEYGGVRRTVKEWATICGISYDTINSRLKRHWPAAQALGYEAREERTAALKRIIHGESQRAMRWRKSGAQTAYKRRRATKRV